MMEKFLPMAIMLESFGACILYFICQKWGTGLYWLSAGLLNFTVIFLIPGE
ncbi:hypothetical protein [Desulfobacula sp.]|uniref:hypothetical protein n=1 Tax=Desulfobacula sp. TaxID=2593537 RepID=UPI00260F670E|nr:hypothetical protein [Desulfobacula sp.]